MPKARRQSSSKVDTVTVTIRGDSLVEVELNALEIDNHLKQLGELRAQMNPQQTDLFDHGERVSTVFNPTWVCEPEQNLANSMLHIHDPRYGWLHYVIPRDVGDELADALTSPQNRRSTKH